MSIKHLQLQQSTFTILNAQVCFNGDVENSNVAYRIATFLHMMKGASELKFLSRYSQHIVENSDNLKDLRGAYGPRMRNWIGANQLQEMINMNSDIDQEDEEDEELFDKQRFYKPAGIDQMMAVFDDIQMNMNVSTIVVRDPGIDFDETDDIPDLTSISFTKKVVDGEEMFIGYANYQEGMGPNFLNEVWSLALLTQLYSRMLKLNPLNAHLCVSMCNEYPEPVEIKTSSLHCNTQTVMHLSDLSISSERFWEDLEKLHKLSEHIQFYLNEKTFKNPAVSVEQCGAVLEKVLMANIEDPVLHDMGIALAVWAFWHYGSRESSYAGDYVEIIVQLLGKLNNTFIAVEVRQYLTSNDIPFELELACE